MQFAAPKALVHICCVRVSTQASSVMVYQDRSSMHVSYGARCGLCASAWRQARVLLGGSRPRLEGRVCRGSRLTVSEQAASFIVSDERKHARRGTEKANGKSGRVRAIKYETVNPAPPTPWAPPARRHPCIPPPPSPRPPPAPSLARAWVRGSLSAAGEGDARSLARLARRSCFGELLFTAV